MPSQTAQTTYANDRERQRVPSTIPARFTGAHQEQRQTEVNAADFSRQFAGVVAGEYEREDGVVAPAPLPFYFTVKGPPTLRRSEDASGNKPYVVSNGGNPLEVTEGTS